MSNKIALVRVSDVEPLLSILPMLGCAGYAPVLPNLELRNYLRDSGCRNVDNFDDMARRWGCEMPPSSLQEVGPRMLDSCDLYVDVNGCHNGPKLWDRHPNLKGKVLTYFINGGEPRNVPDKGDCQTPATPMMTTAQHYHSTLFCPTKHPNVEAFSCDDPPNPRGYWTNTSLSHPEIVSCGPEECSVDVLCPWGCGPLVRAPWLGKVYVFWPRFCREDRVPSRTQENYGNPVSFVHNCLSWGCQQFVEPARKLGVMAYGGGNSPDGLIRHEEVFSIYSKALCTVYLKGGGAVDYSILEPMACGCPTTFHESYVHNTRMYDLLIPRETCLTWKDEREMAEVIQRLRDPAENRRIGEAGRKRAQEVQWSPNATSNIEGFRDFIQRNF